MPSLSPNDIARITDYVAGELTSEGLAQTERWIAEDGERVQLAESLRRSRDILREEWAARIDVEANIRTLMAEVARRQGTKGRKMGWDNVSSGGRTEVGKKRQVGRNQEVQIAGQGKGAFLGQTLRGYMWVGALATLVVGVILLGRRRGETSSDTTRVYATNAHQQATITLDDGSHVTLSPQTRLRLRHFDAQSRAVELESGEAYFEVAQASGSPFIVRSGMATAQVLGTAFLVRHEAGNPHVRIAVTDGKVRVTTPVQAGKGIMLTTGQAGDITDSTAQVNTTDDSAPGVEWAPGSIMFRHTPLTTVLQTVTKWYGYHFRFADPVLGAQSVTMMVSTRSSAEALAAIEQVLSMNLTVVGDTITLVPQPPRSSPTGARIRTYDVWTPAREVGR